MFFGSPNREINYVTFIKFIFHFVVEQKDDLSSTGVQIEVLNEIKRMQDSLMVQQQTINVIAAPQEAQGIALY